MFFTLSVKEKFIFEVFNSKFCLISLCEFEFINLPSNKKQKNLNQKFSKFHFDLRKAIEKSKN